MNYGNVLTSRAILTNSIIVRKFTSRAWVTFNFGRSGSLARSTQQTSSSFILVIFSIWTRFTFSIRLVIRLSLPACYTSFTTLFVIILTNVTIFAFVSFCGICDLLMYFSFRTSFTNRFPLFILKLSFLTRRTRKTLRRITCTIELFPTQAWPTVVLSISPSSCTRSACFSMDTNLS